MKKNLRPLVALLILQLGLTNCAYLYSKSGNVAATVDDFAKQQNYGLALKTLEYIDKNHFNYTFLMTEKKRIQKLSKLYEKKSIGKAKKLAKGNHWAEAMLVYDNALKNLPRSNKIENAREKFIAKREKYLKQLKTKLLVSNAKTLSKKTATTKEIAQVNPNDRKAKKILSSHIREVKLTADKLITCAEDSIKTKDFQLAEECLLLASNLETSTTVNKKLNILKNKISSEKNTRRKLNKKSILTISKKLSQVKSNSELIRYKDEILTLYQQDKSNKKIIQLKLELEKRIGLTLTRGIKEGQNLYSQGRIQQALNHWNELHRLKPSNTQLNDYIHRAQKVLKKLQSLSNSQNTVSPPKSVN